MEIQAKSPTENQDLNQDRCQIESSAPIFVTFLLSGISFIYIHIIIFVVTKNQVSYKLEKCRLYVKTAICTNYVVKVDK